VTCRDWDDGRMLATSREQTIRGRRPTPTRQIRILIRLKMVVDICCRRVVLRVTADVGLTLPLVYSHIVELELRGEYHRR